MYTAKQGVVLNILWWSNVVFQLNMEGVYALYFPIKSSLTIIVHNPAGPKLCWTDA